MSQKKTPGVKVVTPIGVISYPNVFEPRAVEQGKEPKYSCTIIFPKSRKAELKALEAAIMQVAQAHFGGTDPKTGKPIDVAAKFAAGKLHHPLKDGDIQYPDDPLYKGTVFIRANSDVRHRPAVVGADVQPIINPEEVYPGMLGRLQVYVCPFEYQNMKFGVTLLLNGLQKVKDGERIDGRTVDFEPVAAEAADPLA